MYKQIIIARKDLGMSMGKFAAQVSHASMAFLTGPMRDPAHIRQNADGDYEYNVTIEKDLYEQWISHAFTKVVLEAKNRYQLLKAKQMAEELGMKENEDFWLIKDSCRTELTPEETDEFGVGRCLTCIGFKPMEDTVIDQIGKKYHIFMS